MSENKLLDISKNIYGCENKELILRDFLAIDRTILANQRTFLSWIRTALNLIITGISFIKLLDLQITWILGYILIFSGMIMFVIGITKYLKWKKHLSEMKC